MAGPEVAPEAPRGVWRSARELAVRTVKDSIEDRAPGLAAEVAFFSILSLPPLILALFGTAGFATGLLGDVTTANVRDWVLGAAESFLAEQTIEESIEPTVDAVLTDGRADVALLGLALAIWSGSRAANVAMRSITVAYDLEPRATWKRRALAIGVTVVGMIAGLVVIPLLVLGPRLGNYLDVPGFHTVWRIAYWPTMALLIAALLATLYHLAVPWWTPWRRDFAGAVLAVAIWLGGSAALRVYAAWTIRADSTYGPLATPIVVLLWLYVTAFAVVLGAELNAEIEKLWPTESTRHELQAEDESPNRKQASELDEGEEAVQA